MGKLSKLFDKENRIWSWRPSYKLVGVCAVLILFVALIPLYRIALYAVPWYDDFSYGYYAKSALEKGGGLLSVLRAAQECVHENWYAWQGTYASIFFMALTPVIWGEEYYFLGAFFLITILTLSVFVLMGVIIRDCFFQSKWEALFVQAITTSMVIMLIHTSQQGFFWYNGGVHYVGMHSIAMLLLAMLIHIWHARKTVTVVLLTLLSMVAAVLVAGSNFVTALQAILVLAAFGLWAVIKKSKRAFCYLAVLAVYGRGFYMNIIAPGNDVRARNYVGWGYAPGMAVLQSFKEAVVQIPEFTGWITPVILIFMAPVIMVAVGKSKCSFRYPGVVLLLSFCFYATGYTPSLYSLGHEGLDRTLNAVKITYQILLVINEIYWIGWLRKSLEKKGKTVGNNMPVWWFYGLTAAVMLVVFTMAPNQAGCYSSYGAYYYVNTGEAYNFYQEYMKRVEILESDKQDVVLEPYRFKPWLLCMGDLDSNPDKEENLMVEKWYDKESVRVKESPGKSN